MQIGQSKISRLLLTLLFLATLAVACHLAIANRNLKRRLQASGEALSESKAPESSDVQSEAGTKKVNSRDDKFQKEIAELRKKLREKEKEISSLRDSIEAGVQPDSNLRRPDSSPDPQQRGDMSWTERMEKLKKENPERYEEMRNRMLEFGKRIESTAVENQNFLANLDKSRMSQEELENHAKIEEMVKVNAELSARINQDPESPESEELRREMFSNFRELREIFDTERNYALKQFARTLGYSDNGADTFTEYVDYIYKMTSMRGYFGGGMGRVMRDPQEERR